MLPDIGYKDVRDATVERPLGVNSREAFEQGDWPETTVDLTVGSVTSVLNGDKLSFSGQLKLSILMCAYNEQNTVAQAITGILETKYPCEIELIVVDDGSTDATPDLIKQMSDSRIISYRHARNSGKGAALLSALSLATGTHVLPFDADLEYDPEDIPKMLVPVLKGRSDVVYGARLFGCNTVYQSYRYAVGNRFLTRLTNLLFNAYLSDLHTCLKLVPLAMFKSLSLSEMGFGLDTELTALLLRNGVRPFEVSVSYYSRPHSQGKKITWRDAIACLWILLRVRMSRARSQININASPRDQEHVRSLAIESACHNLAAQSAEPFPPSDFAGA
jgi:glycosyltransferase involved in cell wall biosynthesis